jgi:dihydroorotate dehydrogenase electron transfer subunit
MVEVNKGRDPLLKRAFSLFRKTDDGFQILYRIKGKGTSILADMKEGAVIEILGPLGNSYPGPSEDQIPLVVAGGIGIASVFSFVERHSKKAYVFYGARSKDELFMLDELRRHSMDLFISTDDGSSGAKGTVVDSLKAFLASSHAVPGRHVIYACGHHLMLQAVSGVAASNDIKAHVALEEHMACGIGACLGCVVKTKSGYKRVCKEGPVFDASEIVW